MAGDDDEKGLVPTEEQNRRRKGRNIALAVTLAVLVVLFYVVTVFKMGGNVANRPL